MAPYGLLSVVLSSWEHDLSVYMVVARTIKPDSYEIHSLGVPEALTAAHTL